MTPDQIVHRVIINRINNNPFIYMNSYNDVVIRFHSYYIPAPSENMIGQILYGITITMIYKGNYHELSN